MSFNQRLKELRFSQNLTQSDFAELAGVGKKSQINYEKGERFPDAKYLMALAENGYDIKYLLTGTPDASKLTFHQYELLDFYSEASPIFKERVIDLFMIEQLQSPKIDNLACKANILELITGHRVAGELNEEETLLLLEWKSTPPHIKKGVFNLLATNWFDDDEAPATQSMRGDNTATINIQTNSGSGDVAGRDINK